MKTDRRLHLQLLDARERRCRMFRVPNENKNVAEKKQARERPSSTQHFTLPLFAFSTAHINEASVSTSSLPLMDGISLKCFSTIPANTTWSSSRSANIGVRLRLSSSSRELLLLLCSLGSRRGRFAGVIRGGLDSWGDWRKGFSRDEGGGGSSAVIGEGYTWGTMSYCVKYR